jgi:hypothetical protein
MSPAVKDDVKIEENVLLIVRGPDGEIKQELKADNLVTTKGAEGIADRLLAAPAVEVPTHMAIGTGTEAAAVGDTKLKTELDRNALTAKTRSGKVVTYKSKWEAGDGTGAITEAGILNAGSEGTLFNRVVFSVVNKGAEDTLEIIWTTTVG